MRDTEWMAAASCTQVDLTQYDPFFPDAEYGNVREQARDAALICADCPVQVECLTYAHELRIPTGVFGGKLRNHRYNGPRENLTPCGTDAGYARHHRQREAPCQACLKAHNMSRRERQARRRA